jgi:Transcriptional regulators
MAEQRAKYEIIVDWIQDRLEDYRINGNSKIESENELAAIFGVSRQTVRHAISVLERRGILEKKRGSGTFIKEQEVSEVEQQRTMRIGIITTYVDEYIFPPIIREMEMVLAKAGYSIQIAFTHNSIETERTILTNILKNTEVDGIIAESVKGGLPSPNLHLYERLKEKGMPIIFINSYYETLHVPHVSMNDSLAGKLATEHLIQCGHVKIGGIFKSDDGQGKLRYLGYIEALLEAEMKVRSDQVAWVDTEDMRGNVEDFARVLKRLCNCTACVCYNDEVASKLVAICLAAGIKIPEELSIVGIDNSELARLCEIPFTSIENPIRDLGRNAATGIIELIKGKTLKERLELEPRIVTRDSVKLIKLK